MLEQQFSDTVSQVYARLDQEDVEQFYTGYQIWNMQRRIAALQGRIDTLHQQITENEQYLQQVHLSAIAQTTLARLQAHGVNDIDLLARMLDRGDAWLELSMRHLDYCEQLHVIEDNYTRWCEYALEGAYDWIDSMLESEIDSVPLLLASPTNDVGALSEAVYQSFAPADATEQREEATASVASPTDSGTALADVAEEMLLGELSSEEEVRKVLSLESTFKRPAISLSSSVPTTEETLAEHAHSIAETAPVETPLPIEAEEQTQGHTVTQTASPASLQAGIPVVPVDPDSTHESLETAPTAEAPLSSAVETEANVSAMLSEPASAVEAVLAEVHPTEETPLPIEVDAPVELPHIATEQQTLPEHAIVARAEVHPASEAPPPVEAQEQPQETLPLQSDTILAFAEQDTMPERPIVARAEVRPTSEASPPVEAQEQPQKTPSPRDTFLSLAQAAREKRGFLTLPQIPPGTVPLHLKKLLGEEQETQPLQQEAILAFAEQDTMPERPIVARAEVHPASEASPPVEAQEQPQEILSLQAEAILAFVAQDTLPEQPIVARAEMPATDYQANVQPGLAWDTQQSTQDVKPQRRGIGSLGRQVVATLRNKRARKS